MKGRGHFIIYNAILLIVNKCGLTMLTRYICLRRGSSEYGTEPLGSIVGSEFLYLMADFQILKTFSYVESEYFCGYCCFYHLCFTGVIEIQNLAVQKSKSSLPVGRIIIVRNHFDLWRIANVMFRLNFPLIVFTVPRRNSKVCDNSTHWCTKIEYRISSFRENDNET